MCNECVAGRGLLEIPRPNLEQKYIFVPPIATPGLFFSRVHKSDSQTIVDEDIKMYGKIQNAKQPTKSIFCASIIRHYFENSLM